MTQALIDVYRHVPKLVSHLHLPVQSGSDRILAAMKRGYTALEYKSIVRRLRDARPQLSLTSDFIVGFPGRNRGRFRTDHETDRRCRLRWQLQLRLQRAPGHSGRAIRRSRSHAPSAQARLERLQAVVEGQYRARSEAMVGGIERVLVTGRAATECRRSGGPHRQQSRSELSRRRWSDRAARRRADHRRAGAFAARRTGRRFLSHVPAIPAATRLRRKP